MPQGNLEEPREKGKMYMFAFKSRNQAMRYFDSLKRRGIIPRIISTPGEIAIGCGLSVCVQKEQVPAAKSILISEDYNSFMGLFYVEYFGNRVITIKRQ